MIWAGCPCFAVQKSLDFILLCCFDGAGFRDCGNLDILLIPNRVLIPSGNLHKIRYFQRLFLNLEFSE